jgi:hypothetical protein
MRKGGPKGDRGSCGNRRIRPERNASHVLNPAPAPVRYLLVMTANIFRLIQAIHAASDRSPAALAALFRKHDSELLDESMGD